jgi:vanillate O-demethylase ferredoxin subunit
MKLTVTQKTPVATDTMRIRLAAQNGEALPVFKPGAHIELSFEGMTRRYSLTSSPQELEFYEISVLRTSPSRGGSHYLHDSLQVGAELDSSGPINAFPLNLDAKHSVFIAGGIGITPIITMMEALRGAGQSFELHYAAQKRDRFLPIPLYTAHVEFYTDKDGRPSLDVDALLDDTEADTDLYVCGPRPLIEAVRIAAGARGWPDARVHFESFGAIVKPSDAPITVHLAQSGLTIDIEPGTAILDALLENGVWAAYECKRGECASCITEVLSGEIEHRDVCLSEEQRRSVMCTCVSWARSSEIELNL